MEDKWEVALVIRELAGVAEHDYAHELVAALERDTAGSIDLSLRHARVRLTHRAPAALGQALQGQATQDQATQDQATRDQATRDRAIQRQAIQGQAILAEASAEYDGRRIRAQVATASVAAATDVLGDVLRHRMSRLGRRWEVGLDEQFTSAPDAWRHHAEKAHRPRHLPRPAQERKVLRHKSFDLELCTADEAIEDMELMGYLFQLFRDLESGQDSVVYRDGTKGYRIALVKPTGRNWRSKAALTVSPHAATPMSLAEAAECLDLTGWPFVFHADPLTGHGRVLYRRYDGHYALITRA